MIKYFALVILSISFFFMTGCNNTSKSGLEESQHTVISQGMAEYVEDERETLELPDDSNYITQSSDVDFDGDGIADHLYIRKNRKDEEKGHTLYFHSSLIHDKKAGMKENYNISDDDLECIVGVYGNYYNRSYSNAIQGADITGDGVNEIFVFVPEFKSSGEAISYLSVYKLEDNEFVRIEPETADEGHMFTIVRDGTRVKIACDTNKYEEYFWDTIDNLDNHTDIYNGKTEFLAKPEYATLTTYEGKTCIKYTFCLGSKWKWYEINELVDYENGAWKTVEMQADIHDDTITDYMRKKSDNSLQYSYDMSDEELLSLAITEIISEAVGDVPFRVDTQENIVFFWEQVDDGIIQSAISSLGDAADRLNISNLRNENNIFILFEISQ